jgi:hypothetical protein
MEAWGDNSLVKLTPCNGSLLLRVRPGVGNLSDLP